MPVGRAHQPVGALKEPLLTPVQRVQLHLHGLDALEHLLVELGVRVDPGGDGGEGAVVLDDGVYQPADGAP